MKKLTLFLLFLCLALLPKNFVYASNYSDINTNVSAKEGADFICKNTTYLNELSIYYGGNGEIDACKISPINIILGNNLDERGVLIRFNNSGGYLVMGANYEIFGYDFKDKEIIDAKHYDLMNYDVKSGFISNKNNKDMDILNTAMNSPVINGGTTSSGVVIDKDVYITEEYGSKYNLASYNSLSSRLGDTQGELSVYEKVYLDSNGNVQYTATEGNCAVVAAYNYLKFLRYDHDTRYTNLPYGYTYFAYDPAVQESVLYQEMVQNNDYWIFDGNTYFGSVKAIKDFSYLYAETRQESIDINDYPWGLNVWQTRDVINNVLTNNGYTNSHHSVIEVPTTSTITNNINDGNGFILSVLGDIVYGTHEMFVSGYYSYLWVENILFFHINHYVYLLEIRDGWGSDIRYYDISISLRTWATVFITMD